MESSQPPTPPPADAKPESTVFHKAATFCLVAPLVAIAVNFMSPSAATVVLSVGIVAGLFALCGIPKFGKKGILVKTVVGLLIQVLLIISAIYTGAKVKEFAREIQEKAAAEKQK